MFKGNSFRNLEVVIEKALSPMRKERERVRKQKDERRRGGASKKFGVVATC